VPAAAAAAAAAAASAGAGTRLSQTAKRKVTPGELRLSRGFFLRVARQGSPA